MAESFKKLIVWQKAVELAVQVQDATSRFPNEERYGLSSQMRRAAVSIPSNIAEGYGRVGQRDYVHFLGIARGSAYELQTQVVIATRVGYVVDGGIESLIDEICKMLTSQILQLQKKYVREQVEEYN